MTTYKQKYHLKKTQPLKSKQRASNQNYIKQSSKPQKASTLTIKTSSNNLNTYKKRNLRQKIFQKSNNQEQQKKKLKHPNEKQYQQKEKNTQNNNNNQQKPRKQPKQHTLSQQKQKQNEKLKQYSKTSDNIFPHYHHRNMTTSIVQKYTPSPHTQSLQYPKKTPIQQLQKINILHSVQNFWNKIIKGDNGCICQQPCQWSQRLFKWVDIPQYLVKEHYKELIQKIENFKENGYNGEKYNHNRDNTKSHNIVNDNSQSRNNIHPHTLNTFHNQFSLFSQPSPSFFLQIQSSFKQIKKDIKRTHSSSQTFQNPIFSHRLQNVLKCYVLEDYKIGYIQGMNMILSGILYHVKEQSRTYSIFRKLLYSIRSIYLDSFKQCYVHINRIQYLMKIHLNDVFHRFHQLQIQLNMICLPWILSLLTVIVPLEYIHLVYYGFIKDRWNWMYRTCLSIFVYMKDKILQQGIEASQIFIMFSSSQQDLKDLDWQDIMKFGQTIEINWKNGETS